MRLWKVIGTLALMVSLILVYTLNLRTSTQRKAEDQVRQIQALEEERYAQRREIAKYHSHEIKLWIEITRLKNLLGKRTAPAPLHLASSQE